MNILIITTYYPPDTAIAAVRPYMFAKHLKKMGHEVTVIRSGEIGHGLSPFYKNDPSIRVLSFYGSESMAERYERGEHIENNFASSKPMLDFLPGALRSYAIKCYFKLFGIPFFNKQLNSVKMRLEKQKALLDSLKHEDFDVVFSTYGLTENIYAGQYAAELFGCPLIQDFRDTLANREFQNPRQYAVMKKIQDDAIKKSNVCTAVSEGVLQEVCPEEYRDRGKVLYNGYEAVNEEGSSGGPTSGELSFCYTGQVYIGKQDFSPLLKALRLLAGQKRICLDKVQIHYAGRNFDYLYQQAKKYGVETVLTNHGQMQREDVFALQKRSDLFVVLSWNTKKSKGVLTGKFFEGIRAKKPILAMVAGDTKNSELLQINQKYSYGFCYENCQKKNQFDELCAYIERCYNEKMKNGVLNYMPNPSLNIDFQYKTLAARLEKICLDLINPN